MNRRDLENGIEENREVTELLAALPRVEAPANFDFGVKARIAAGGLKRQSTMFPFLKVAVPLSLVLLVGAFVFYYGTMPSALVADVANVAAPQNYTADSSRVIPTEGSAPRNETPPTVSGPQVTEPGNGGTQLAVAEPKKEIPVSRTTRRGGETRAIEERGNSKVEALGQPKKIFTPPGIPSSDGGEFSVRETLEIIGMKVDFASGKWHVLSTTANSIAEKSGVLASDVVESINEQAIRGKDKLKGKLEAKMLTVSRGGKSIKLELKR